MTEEVNSYRTLCVRFHDYCQSASFKRLHKTIMISLLSAMDKLNAGMRRLEGCSRRWLPKNQATGTGIFQRYFSRREVAQASLGFSPLVYGRSVRGPMSVLRDIWADEDINEQTRTTYQYVLELRERLESTCKLAHGELRKAQGNHH